MKIVKVAKEHNCITCGKVIKVKNKALLEFVDRGSVVGRHYYCMTCTKVILKELQKELK